MASKKVKPGTKKLINGKKMVMGYNGRWVSQAVFNRQKQARQAENTRASKNTPGERTRVRPKPVPRGSQGRQLEGAGKTNALTAKSRYQRGLRRDKLARQQLSNFGRAFKRTLKQSAAENKLKNAAKGTKGDKVRYNAGSSKTAKALPPGKKGGAIRAKGGPLAKRSPGGKMTKGKIVPVNVKVDPPSSQKQLKGKNSPKSISAEKRTKPRVKVRGTRPSRPVSTSGAKPRQAPKVPTRSQVERTAQAKGRYSGKKPPVPPSKPAKEMLTSSLKEAGITKKGATRAAGAAGVLADYTLRVTQGQDPFTAAVDTGLGTLLAVGGGMVGGRFGGPVGGVAGNLGGYAIGSNLRSTLFGDAPVQSSRGEGRANANPRPIQQQPQQPQQPRQTGLSNIPPQEGPFMNPQYGQPGNFNNPALQVPVQPVANPAAASQVPGLSASPRPLPQTPGGGPTPTMSTTPRTETRQRPTDLKEGLAMWEEIHKNSQKSVIDGLNIVERYRAKMAAA